MTAGLFYLNGVWASLGLLLTARSELGRGRLWSVSLVPWMFIVVFLFIYPAITQSPLTSEPTLNLLISAGLAGITVGTIVVARGACQPKVSEGSVRVNSLVLAVVAALYFAYLIGEPIMMVAQQGIIGLVTRDRLQDYLGGGILKGSSVLDLVALLLAPFFYVWIGTRLEKRDWWWASLGAAAMVFRAFATANTRFPVLMPILALGLTVAHVRRKTLSVATWLLAVSLLLGAMVLYNWAGNLVRSGQTAAAHSSQVADSLDQDAQYYTFLYDLSRVDFPDEYGRQYWLNPFIALVPRAVWEDKPITSTANILSEAVYGIRIGRGDPVTTFTVIGEGYWQLGWLGAALGPIMFIFGYAWIIALFQRYQGGFFCSAMVLMQATTFFRSELPMVHFVTWTASYLMLWLFRTRPAGRREKLGPGRLKTAPGAARGYALRSLGAKRTIA